MSYIGSAEAEGNTCPATSNVGCAPIWNEFKPCVSICHPPIPVDPCRYNFEADIVESKCVSSWVGGIFKLSPYNLYKSPFSFL